MGSGFTELTPAQFALRLHVAQGLTAAMISDPELPEFARATYAAAPPWGFYVSIIEHPEATVRLRRRVYGALTADDSDALHVHAASARIGWVNLVVGGVPVAQLTRIDAWNAADLVWFEHLPPSMRSAFIDPLGFTVWSV